MNPSLINLIHTPAFHSPHPTHAELPRVTT